MNKTKTFLKYAVPIVLMLVVIFSSTTASAVGEPLNSGGSNGDEGNGTPATGSGSNADEGGGGNGTPKDDDLDNGRNPSGGRSGSPIVRTNTQISNIQVTPVGSSSPTTTLSRGQAYTISWTSSESGVNNSINFVPNFSGSNLLVGSMVSQNGANNLNWTVSSSAAFGNYFLRFNSSNPTRETLALNMYTIAGAPAILPIAAASGPTAASAGQSNGSGSDENGTLSEDLSVGSEDSPLFDVIAESQLAQTTGSGNWLANKYFLWFFILLLIVGGGLLVQERRKHNSKLF